MSADDIGQIIDRLDRMEGKQDRQAEQIADLRVTLASITGENSGQKSVKGDFLTKISSYGGLLAGVGAIIAVLFMGAK